jgi:hypothetical protein
MKLQTPTMDIFLKTVKEGKCNSNINNLDTMQCEIFSIILKSTLILNKV